MSLLVILLLALTALAFPFFARRVARRAELAERTVARAQVALSSGDDDVASALLDQLDERAGRYEAVARAILRAQLLMRAGDHERARELLDEALAARPLFFTRHRERLESVNARGLRALLRAAAGDEPGARDDIEAVDTAEWVPADAARARAALADVVLSEKREGQATLRGLLEERAGVLRLGLSGRERALVRGYQRLAEGSDPSVYRRPGSDAPVDAALSDWAAGLLPSVAPYVRVESVASAPTVELSTVAGERAQQAVAKAHAATVPPVRTRFPYFVRALLLWLALILAFIVAWSVPGLIGALGAFGVGVLAIGGSIGLSLRGGYLNRRAFRRLSKVVRMIPDDLKAARRALASSKADPPGAALAANVELVDATIAYRLGELELALQSCDRALALLNGASVVVGRNADQIDQQDARVAPALREQVSLQRLSTLAALGRHDEAWAEYGRSQQATRADGERIALFERIHAGDVDGAYQLVSGRSLDMAITPRDEALGDAVRIAAGEVSDAERRRIDSALEADPDMQVWLAAVAPGLLAESHTRGQRETPSKG